jgi:hypothetical protein
MILLGKEAVMKKYLKVILTVMAAASVVIIAGGRTPASAQYVVSARAGLVNYTSGSVTYNSSTDPSWREIPTHLQLDEGDRIRTGERGKAEILLNPGSYLRLANSAELIVHQTSLVRMGFELLSGSAVLEVGNLGDESEIRINTPYSVVKIEDEGLYRLDVASGAMTLAVRQGKAFFLQPDGSFKKVKKGKRVLIPADGRPEIASLDKNFMDDFDLWSADRAEMLLAANQSYIRRYGLSGPSVLWNAWVFDPFFGCYTFLPWGYYFGSPYGYGFYYPYYGRGYYSGGYWSGGHRGGGGQTSTRQLPGGGSPHRDRDQPRPKLGGVSDDKVFSGNRGSIGRTADSAPIYTKSPSLGSHGSSAGRIGGGSPQPRPSSPSSGGVKARGGNPKVQ